MKSNCNIKGLAGLNDPFLPDKAKRINAALKKMAAPFYQVCSSLPDKSSKDSKKLSWRRYSQSCIDGYTNARWCSDKEVDAFLQKNYNVALSTFERNPEKYSDAKPLEKKPTKRELEAQKKSERAAKAKATREARKAEELRKNEERRAKLEAKKAEKKNQIPDSGEMVPTIVGTGLFPRQKEYEIIKRIYSNGSARYSYKDSKGNLRSMTKVEAMKYLDKYKAAHPQASGRTEPEKKTEEAKPVLPPPVQAKTYELKKFATAKPYKQESKNQAFVDWAKKNYDWLKSDYSKERKAKELPRDVNDFQDFALHHFRDFIKTEKAKVIPRPEPKPIIKPEPKPAPMPEPDAKTGGDYSAINELLKQAIAAKMGR